MKAFLILGSPQARNQARLVQSGKRWLLLSRVEGEATTEGLNPGQALQPRRPPQDDAADHNHIRDVQEGSFVESTG